MGCRLHRMGSPIPSSRRIWGTPSASVTSSAGVGGFRIAFKHTGCQCVFSCDWDKHSQQTYAANFGETPHGDIRDVAVADIPKFDILCAGFPCQPFSIAGVSKKLGLGRKHGFEDKEQGNLFSISPRSSASINRPPSCRKTSHTSNGTTAGAPSTSSTAPSPRSFGPTSRVVPCSARHLIRW